MRIFIVKVRGSSARRGLRRKLFITAGVFMLAAALVHIFSSVIVPAFYLDRLSGAVVMIDPGHGGVDGGAYDGDKLLEKDINLEISLKLREFLEKEGVTVKMTRSSDISMDRYSDLQSSRYRRDLDGRKRLINKSGAQLLISIHTNACPSDTGVRGMVVFYYPGLEKGMELAEEVTACLDSMVYKDLLKYEEGLTRMMPYDLYVLRETHMPGILVEVGFMTNPEDKKLISDSRYKERAAEAICKGIVNFLNN
jgi:N-acetylmuramoyl-L-alanine amidase